MRVVFNIRGKGFTNILVANISQALGLRALGIGFRVYGLLWDPTQTSFPELD